MSTVSKMQEELNKAGNSLDDMPKIMRVFTLCLRTLFVEYPGGKSSDEYAHMVMELRNRTRDDAQVYLRTIIPACVLFLTNTKEYFRLFKMYDLEKWKTHLVDITDTLTELTQLATTVVAMHELLMTPLKTRQDEAKVIIKKYELDVTFLQGEQKQLEELAENQRLWAKWLLFIPVVAEIAGPILNTMANKNSVEAFAKQENVNTVEKAIWCISESLVPALSAFITGLQTLTGAFKVIEQELVSSENISKKSLKSQKNMFYDQMQYKSKQIIEGCDNMFRVIPAVKTDILAIDSQGTDEKYVNQWVEKQKQIIRNAGMEACLFDALNSIKD